MLASIDHRLHFGALGETLHKSQKSFDQHPLNLIAARPGKDASPESVPHQC